MELKQTWISPQAGSRTGYSGAILGGVVGIVALMMALIFGGVALSSRLDLPRELFSVLLCAGVTALGSALALRLGRRVVRDTTLFFLTTDDRLFVLDARDLHSHGNDVLDYAAGVVRTQRFLRRMAERPYLPEGAGEILSVERIKENRSHYAIRCRVGRPGRQGVRRTCILVKGGEREEMLLRQLERRMDRGGGLEPGEDRNPVGIVVSALVLVCLVGLCILSHPAVARLPRRLYFPCLGAAFLALCALVTFVVKQRRGE